MSIPPKDPVDPLAYITSCSQLSPTLCQSRIAPILSTSSTRTWHSQINMAGYSKRLITAYALDWVLTAVLAAAGWCARNATPPHRPFSLVDLSISYPLVKETISTPILIKIVLLGPAMAILLVTLLLVPGPKITRQLSRKRLIELKLWELERGLAGLSLSIACAFFITKASKNFVGKPRPNFLAHCQPDISASAVAAHAVGQYAQTYNEHWTLVDSGICRNTNKLDNGFRSFPSGHSSLACAGMLYLSLYLCAKFAIRFPHLPVEVLLPPTEVELLPIQEALLPNAGADDKDVNRSMRDTAASPPNYLIVVAFIPIAVAIWVCTTPYKEFYHSGVDILTGSLIGIICAIFSFHWYHMPLSRGQGWAWGPRNRNSAFGIGVGAKNYVE